MGRGQKVAPATGSHSKPVKCLILFPSLTFIHSCSSQTRRFQGYWQTCVRIHKPVLKNTLSTLVHVHTCTHIQYECLNSQVIIHTETRTKSTLVFLSSGLYFTTGSGQATRTLKQGRRGLHVHPLQALLVRSKHLLSEFYQSPKHRQPYNIKLSKPSSPEIHYDHVDRGFV